MNKTKNKIEYNYIIDKEDLKIYYESYYPYKLIKDFLNCGENEDDFIKREFSIIDFETEHYNRYLSFKNENSFINEIKIRIPKKIDIGPIYNLEPNKYKQYNIKPIKKEFIIDIDLSDYDFIRNCCSGKKMCNKCWKFIKVAYLIINNILKNDFGFKNIIYFFSGGRGIHCWVKDESVTKYDSTIRSSIIRYINFHEFITENNSKTKPFKDYFHPSLIKSLRLMNNYFLEIFTEQKILEFDKGIYLFKSLIYKYMPMSDLNYIENKILKNTKFNSVEKLNKTIDFLKINEKINGNAHLYNTNYILDDFKYNCLFPRIDENVSIIVNHLIKSPFSVHPETGYISIPLTHEQICNFKLSDILHIEEIINDHYEGIENAKLKNFLDYFQKFINNI